MRYFFTILTVITFSVIFKQIVYADPVVMKAGRAAFDTISTKVDDYIWPTKIPRRITSSFGEFRSNHFHAGLDISTENKIGVGVFAMREGYVEKATVSPYGYGKIIVLKHPCF